MLDSARPPMPVALTGSLVGTHDPAVLRAGDRYYMFHTGRGVQTKTSTNLTTWTAGSAVFSANPSWIAQQVPGATDLWAPDISYFGGVYHLYYSASTFSSNRSCIGHATRAALDSGSWSDHGPVVCSNTGTTRDNWNAIDPNAVVDEAGMPWLAFGSFWSGIKMIRLDNTGARVGTELLSLADRPQNDGALEAPFIIRRCGFYYLFVSWDRCCDGANSTYNIRVGRGTSVSGPYMDKAGVAMVQGGGTLLVTADARWKGPGHNAVLVSGNLTYNVYHSYDAQNGGRQTLRISDLAWDANGWPVSGGP
jgi:arabinan endo-1,5-alpha-L-arabinosidase